MGDNKTQKMMTSNETHLILAIADLVISEGLSFNTNQKPRFNKLLALARTLSKIYQPLTRKLIYKEFLVVVYDQNMESNFNLIKKESDIFRFLFQGDGTIISRIPLLNILVSGDKLQVAVFELVDFQVHLKNDGKKDGTFICNIFLEHIKIDPRMSITDFVMFGGASNVQLGVENLKIIIQRFQLCVELNTVYIYF